MKTSILPCLPTLRGFAGKLLLLTFFACLGFVQVGKGQTTYTWTGLIDNSWVDPGNWSPTSSAGGVEPTTNDNVIFDASISNVFLAVGIVVLVEAIPCGCLFCTHDMGKNDHLCICKGNHKGFPLQK